VSTFEISEATWHRPVAKYGGMKADDAKRLKDLERENTGSRRSSRISFLDIDTPKELNRGTGEPAAPPARP
jgi:putative transposase